VKKAVVGVVCLLVFAPSIHAAGSAMMPAAEAFPQALPDEQPATNVIVVPASAKDLYGGPLVLSPGNEVQFGGFSLFVPTPGNGVEADVILADGSSISYSLDTDDIGVVTIGFDTGLDYDIENPLPSTGEGPTAPVLLDDPCTDNAHNVRADKWKSTYNWYFNASSTPNNIDVDETETHLRQAVVNIGQVNNGSCNHPDNVSATAAYQGRTGRRTSTGPSTCNDNTDGVSVTGFAPIPDSLGLAFTCYWRTRAGATVEADVRVDSSEPWANTVSSCSNEYILETIMTHEDGHVFGLKHVNEARHPNLTMSTKINGLCEVDEETLGKGDWLGLEQLYP